IVISFVTAYIQSLGERSSNFSSPSAYPLRSHIVGLMNNFFGVNNFYCMNRMLF
ncbi:unnamed protein product, partial [Brassica rapa subsp. trilocularis]